MGAKKEFDFGALQGLIQEAAVKSLQQVLQHHRTAEICAFALYSDSDASTVLPSADERESRDRRLAEHNGDPVYKFSPAEWSLEAEGADFFEEVCDLLQAELDENEDDDLWHEWFAEGVYGACVDALEAVLGMDPLASLRRDPGFLVTFHAAPGLEDPAQAHRIIQRLNSPQIVAEHAAWLPLWGA